MLSRTLLIRVDASVTIGTGHVMRCLALAQAWRQAGNEVVFAMSQTFPAIEARIAAENCAVVRLRGEIAGDEDCECAQMLARKCSSEWVVLDGYLFGVEYQRKIKGAGFRLLVLDDVGLPHGNYADAILNQNIHANETLYPGCRNGATCLLGPQFALLRREFRVLGPVNKEIRRTGTRVLVMMGGTDPENVTEKVLCAVQARSSESLQMIVVVGPGNPHIDGLRRLISEASCQIEIVDNPCSIAELMRWADIAISAAGSTVWELCLLGVPSMLLATAPNQIPGAQELARLGIAVYLGRPHDVVWSRLADEARSLLASQTRRKQMSQAAKNLVDGEGAKRAVDALRAADLKLRRVTEEDCVLLWQWVNDPEVRSASFQTAPIPFAEHKRWFTSKMKSEQTVIYIAEDGTGTPIGQFRVEWDEIGGTAQVGVTIAPEKRGLGFASSLIRRATKQASEETGVRQFHAYIKPENQASLHAFKSAGFSGFERDGSSIHCSVKVDIDEECISGCKCNAR